MENVKFRSDFIPIVKLAVEVAKQAQQGWLPVCAAPIIVTDGPMRMWVFSSKLVDEAEETPSIDAPPIDNKPVLPTEQTAQTLPQPTVVPTPSAA
jgi:outer membrane biosynthesis protein TonB